MWDFLISLFFVFAMFAGLVSGANEILAQLFGWRSNVLREAIAGLLGEKPSGGRSALDALCALLGRKAQGGETTAKLFAHPLISTLALPGEKPSYIHAETFAAALVRTVASDGSLASLSHAVRNGGGALGPLLGPMLDEARGDLGDFERRVAAHYDRVMDRAQGWYKRRTQAVMLGLAVLLAVLLNVDALYIAQRLSHDAALRGAIALVAEDATRKRDAANERASAPKGETAAREDHDQYAELAKQFEALRKDAEKMEALGLPIGWRVSNGLDGGSFLQQDQRFWSALFGWILAAIAASLGAPFWFDAIVQVINLRGAGTKPNRTDDAATGAAPSASVTATASPAPALAVPPAVKAGLTDYEATRLNEVDIEALQRALGSPPSEVDGLLDDRLRARLRSWQELHGQPASGRFDEPTVLAILYP